MISQGIRSLFPDGFWPASMDNAAQYRSLEDFGRAIYPLWKGVAKKDAEAEAALSGAEVHAKGQVLFEVQTMHRQDLAIHRAGIQTTRTDENQSKMNALRQKAARAAGGGYKDWCASKKKPSI